MDVLSIILILVLIYPLVEIIKLIRKIILGFKIDQSLERTLIFVLIFIVGTIVYFRGMNGQPEDISVRFFQAVTSSIKAIFGEFRSEIIDPLYFDKWSFKLLYWFSSMINLLFLIFTIIAVVWKRGRNALLTKQSLKSKNLIVVGEIEKINIFLKSLETKIKTNALDMFNRNKCRVICILDKNESKIPIQTTFIYPVLYESVTENFLDKIINTNNKYEQQLISLYSSDQINTKILVSYSKLINRFPHLNIFAFIGYSNLEKPDFYAIDKALKNKVSFYSYHQMVAYNQVIKYPITRHKIPQEAKVKHVFIGFSRTNQEMIKHNFIMNQHRSIDHQYIVIKDNKIKNKGFIDSIDYMKDSNINTDDYFDVSDIRIELDKIKIISTNISFSIIKKIIKDLNSYNRSNIYISVGNDLDNIELGHELSVYLAKHHLNEKVDVFIEIADTDLNIKYIINKNNFIKIGDFNEVYTYEMIINESLNDFSAKIHHYITDDQTEWNNLSLYNKQSSRYAAMTIRTKLHFLGLDLTLNKEEKINAQTYYKLYDPENLRFDFYSLNNKSKKLATRYLKNNIRNEIAWYEHRRWTAYMVLNGFIPMNKKEIEAHVTSNNSEIKDLHEKKHACITSFKGLVELFFFLEDLRKKHNINLDSDKLIYDYYVMDNLPSILEKAGYYLKIIK